LTLSLTACGKKQIYVTPLEPIKLDLPDLAPLELNDVEWYIVTEDNAEELFKKLEREGKYPVFFGMAGESYEDMSINFIKIRNHIELQNVVIDIYKDYYEKNESE
jgi:hypothetical protein